MVSEHLGDFGEADLGHFVFQGVEVRATLLTVGLVRVAGKERFPDPPVLLHVLVDDFAVAFFLLVYVHELNLLYL